ncbi:MAG: insulinase family protein [Chloroflexi bacterium]|nr:insulinase family protein [Chloroflexota bacterium]
MATATSSTQPHTLPGPETVTRVELENGIIVLVRENFMSPSVVVEGALRSGALLEPTEKAGLASFHSSMVTRGTENYTFDELYEEIESNGASLSVGSGRHTTTFGSKSLAEDLKLMLTLQADVLRRPTLPQEQIEKVRGQKLTNLQLRAYNTRAMASLTFAELAYPNHPFATSSSGYMETVQAISRDDLLAHQKTLGPRGAIIVIVGAVQAEHAIDLVRETFGDWTNPDQPDAPLAPDAAPLTEKTKKMVPIPGKSQSDIVMGVPGPRRNAPDYQAARMANSILGVFGLMGRLGDSVREQQGLAYYSYSRLNGGLGPGAWSISAGVAPENVEQAVDSIEAEIRSMVEQPVSAEELADNHSFFKGQLQLGLETNDGVAGTLFNMELYDLGLDYLLNYEAMIDAVSIEAIRAAAAQYLNPDAYALAIAGPGQADES